MRVYRFKEQADRKRRGESDLSGEVSEALSNGYLFRFEPWSATIL